MSADIETQQITTGELSRAVTLIRGDIKDVKKDISERPTVQDFSELKNTVEKRATVEALNHALQRVRDLEDWQKWAMRLGIPALIGVIVNLLNTVDGKIPG